MDRWWSDIDDAVLHCLAESGGATAPGEIGRRLGMSEAATQSVLSLLAQEGKVRICAVERTTIEHRSAGGGV